MMNYAIKHYDLASNPCRAADSIGKSKAEEMNIWTQEQYEQFSDAIQKSSVKLAFDVLFYTGMRFEELLALTPADILPSKRIDINKNYAKVNGEDLFLEPKHPKPNGVYPYQISFIMISVNMYPNYMGLKKMTGSSTLRNLPWTRK